MWRSEYGQIGARDVASVAVCGSVMRRCGSIYLLRDEHAVLILVRLDASHWPPPP